MSGEGVGTPGSLAAQFAGHRYHRNFPTEWGPPEGSGTYDPERVAWVRRMVETHTVEGRAAVIARWEGRGRTTSPAEARARLDELERRAP